MKLEGTVYLMTVSHLDIGEAVLDAILPKGSPGTVYTDLSMNHPPLLVISDKVDASTPSDTAGTCGSRLDLLSSLKEDTVYKVLFFGGELIPAGHDCGDSTPAFPFQGSFFEIKASAIVVSEASQEMCKEALRIRG